MKKTERSILFTDKSYEYMTNELIRIANLKKGEFSDKRFPNNELYITLQTEVEEQNCFVLGTIAPPDSNLFSFLLLCDTLKKEKTAKITAVLPYLAYSRHDKNEHKKSFATALLGKFFSQTGVDKLITFDIHSLAAKKLFPIDVQSIYPAKLFAEEIVAQALQNATIIAPDEGAIERCKAVAKEVGIMRDVAYLEKKRTEKEVAHSNLHGDVSEQAIIIDDILDTGETLVSCCKILRSMGVKKICIMVTHGLFTGNKWQELWELGVNRIYCTNTVPLQNKSANIIVLSIVPLLGYFLN